MLVGDEGVDGDRGDDDAKRGLGGTLVLVTGAGEGENLARGFSPREEGSGGGRSCDEETVSVDMHRREARRESWRLVRESIVGRWRRDAPRLPLT